jgi:hypothetical protein
MFFLIRRSHSISFTRARGIPKYKIGFGRGKGWDSGCVPLYSLCLSQEGTVVALQPALTAMGRHWNDPVVVEPGFAFLRNIVFDLGPANLASGSASHSPPPHPTPSPPPSVHHPCLCRALWKTCSQFSKEENLLLPHVLFTSVQPELMEVAPLVARALVDHGASNRIVEDSFNFLLSLAEKSDDGGRQVRALHLYHQGPLDMCCCCCCCCCCCYCCCWDSYCRL